MELARLTDRFGDEQLIDVCEGENEPVIITRDHGQYAAILATDALQLLDAANLNTTANELRAKLEEAHQTIAQLRKADTVRPAVDRMAPHHRIARAMGCEAYLDESTGEVILRDKTTGEP